MTITERFVNGVERVSIASSSSYNHHRTPLRWRAFTPDRNPTISDVTDGRLSLHDQMFILTLSVIFLFSRSVRVLYSYTQ